MTEKAAFHDHFSERAPGYAIYRPTYPIELVDYLARTARGADAGRPTIQGENANADMAWEAGCGSGQLTLVLAQRFARVVATDASVDQIARARPHPRVEYKVARAESSGLPGQCVDLAVAAQAAHWFDLDGYYSEVRRVARPGGIVALVVYGIHITDDPPADLLVKTLYHETLSGYWPPQRKMVEQGYRTMPFPFEELTPPQFDMRADWTVEEMLGYIETWSAVGALIKTRGREEIDAFRKELVAAWGAPKTHRTVRWPLSLRVGRCG